MFGKRRGQGRGGFRRRGGQINDSLQKECICPECKIVVPQSRGIPCYMAKCPRCGSAMMGRFNPEKSIEK